MITETDILKMCRSLARKYNDPQETDDLVSEGVLVAYELIAKGTTDRNLIYSHVQREMHDYYNLRRGPVHLPNSSGAHSMTKDTEPEGWTQSAMYNAMYGEVVELDENVLQVESSEDVYARKEFLAYVASKAITSLAEEEWKIIKMRYWEDMTQDEVGEALGISKMSVSRREKAALEKIRNNL